MEVGDSKNPSLNGSLGVDTKHYLISMLKEFHPKRRMAVCDCNNTSLNGSLVVAV